MSKVLLVEDNRSFREAFKGELRDHFPDLVIDEAENGEEAFSKIDGSPPDLIFMDIHLPGKNGLQLTQEIKKDFPHIRIVVLTGYDLPEYRQAARQYGADDFFIKQSLKWTEVEALLSALSPK